MSNRAQGIRNPAADEGFEGLADAEEERNAEDGVIGLSKQAIGANDLVPEHASLGCPCRHN